MGYVSLSGWSDEAEYTRNNNKREEEYAENINRSHYSKFLEHGTLRENESGKTHCSGGVGHKSRISHFVNNTTERLYLISVVAVLVVIFIQKKDAVRNTNHDNQRRNKPHQSAELKAEYSNGTDRPDYPYDNHQQADKHHPKALEEKQHE